MIYSIRIAILGLAVVALLAGASTAQAGWKTDRVEAIAYEVWGDKLRATCPDGIELRYDDPSDYGEDAESSLGWSWASICIVYLNVFPRDLRAWEPLCSTVLHETGHVIGYDHDHTGHGGIMRAEGSYAFNRGWIAGKRVAHWDGTDRRCHKRGRPFLERRGLLSGSRLLKRP